jgi:hypothetical protein
MKFFIDTLRPEIWHLTPIPWYSTELNSTPLFAVLLQVRIGAMCVSLALIDPWRLP